MVDMKCMDEKELESMSDIIFLSIFICIKIKRNYVKYNNFCMIIDPRTLIVLHTKNNNHNLRNYDETFIQIFYKLI